MSGRTSAGSATLLLKLKVSVLQDLERKSNLCFEQLSQFDVLLRRYDVKPAALSPQSVYAVQLSGSLSGNTRFSSADALTNLFPSCRKPD